MELKPNILYLFPGPIYRPDLPDFKGRFEMISDFCKGEIYSWTWEEQYSCYEIDQFTFYGLICRNKYFLKIKLAIFILVNALSKKRHNSFDIVICYDPIFSGVLGCIIKLFTRARLILEINNSSFKDSLTYHYGKGFKTRIKIFLISILLKIVCHFSDQIKVLTEKQIKTLQLSRWKNKISIFNDFVPTYYFQNKKAYERKEILCVGWPFYLKGMDLLVKAFNALKDRYPEFKLRLLGHLVDEHYYIYFHELDKSRISLMRPVYYDVLKDVIQSCYCFVLPSRTEGLPRVLLEAMACGKPIIGTRIGDIPDLIQDGQNGYLIDPGNEELLVAKLETFLSNENKAREMGQVGLHIINTKFSSSKYYAHFREMISKVSYDKKIC